MTMMKLYRCQNPACSEDKAGRLIYDFWSETPVCPKCKLTRREYPDIVIDLSIIHYDPPHPVIKSTPTLSHKGQGVRACDGKPIQAQNKTSIQAGTGTPTIVNCLECRKTDAWKAAMADWGEEVLANDFVHVVNPDGTIAVEE